MPSARRQAVADTAYSGLSRRSAGNPRTIDNVAATAPARATGTDAAFGSGSNASGLGSVALGTTSTASAEGAIASGYLSNAGGAHSIAIGSGYLDTSGSTPVFVDGATTYNEGDVAIGGTSVAGVSGGSGTYDTALGYGASATGSYSNATATPPKPAARGRRLRHPQHGQRI